MLFRSTMQSLGMGAIGKSGRPLPTYLYHTLSVWHEINTAYTARNMSETRQLRSEFADPLMHDRLVRTLREKLGHRLIGSVEAAKVDVADGGMTAIDLGFLEDGLVTRLNETTLCDSIDSCVSEIVDCASRLVTRSGLSRRDISAL